MNRNVLAAAGIFTPPFIERMASLFERSLTQAVIVINNSLGTVVYVRAGEEGCTLKSVHAAGEPIFADGFQFRIDTLYASGLSDGVCVLVGRNGFEVGMANRRDFIEENRSIAFGKADGGMAITVREARIEPTAASARTSLLVIDAERASEIFLQTFRYIFLDFGERRLEIVPFSGIATVSDTVDPESIRIAHALIVEYEESLRENFK